MSVFATRFDPGLDADTLCGYLAEKLNNKSIVCRKIVTTQSRYSSFQVTAECSDVACMYDPDLWPAGTYVRRYYEARRAGGMHGNGQREPEQDTPLAHGEHTAAVSGLSNA